MPCPHCNDSHSAFNHCPESVDYYSRKRERERMPTPLVKTVTRIITLIGPEDAVDFILEHEKIGLTPGRYRLLSRGGIDSVMIMVGAGGTTKHDPTKNPQIYHDPINESEG